ncbi:hypothetical protein [Desulfofalx alkaliphila]|nr:hypothetical protein [Desulfofalx alkaliphila]
MMIVICFTSRNPSTIYRHHFSSASIPERAYRNPRRHWPSGHYITP